MASGKVEAVRCSPRSTGEVGEELVEHPILLDLDADLQYRLGEGGSQAAVTGRPRRLEPPRAAAAR
jgi:hypothetical protein